MAYTQAQRDNMASSIRDIADAMVELANMSNDVSNLWIAGGWSLADLADLSGNNAQLDPQDLVNMVVTFQAFVVWYQTNADTNASLVHRYG
jgi:hypothetical protein